MRQVTRKGLMTVAAASGVLAAAGGGAAHADSGAQGSATNSPGVLSGNTVQAPVEAELNVCGNTVNVVGLLNPAAGNKCSNGGGKHARGGQGGGGHGSSHGGSQADGHTSGSPGVASGNHVQVPVDVPVNLCGNNISVIGIGNGVTGNDCGNSGGGGAHENPGGGHQNPPGDFEEASPQVPGKPSAPGKPGGEIAGGETNTPGTQTVTQPDGAAQLARTGGDLPLGLALPVGAGALIGGALIYRKARAAAL